MDATLSASLLLAAYGLTMWWTHGEYAPLSIIVTFIVFMLNATLYLARLETAAREPRTRRVLTALFVLFYALVLFNPMLRNYSGVLAAFTMRSALWVAGLGFVLFQWPRVAPAGFALCALALIYAHLLVLRVDPAPAIDIWVIYQQATVHLLAGLNPYTQTYPDIYAGRYGYPPGVHYLPATLYLLTPFRALLGDVRVGLWLAHLGCALLLGALARSQGLERRTQALVVLVWLMFPSTFPVLENCWMDTLLGLSTLAALLCWRRGRYGWASAFFGLAMATKQTALVIAWVTLLFFAVQPPPTRARGFRSLALAGTGALGLMLPFALWDWSGYWGSVTQVFRNPMRLDSFNLVALACNEYDLNVQFWQTLVVYLALLPALAWRLLGTRRWRDWMAGVLFLMGLTFYFGKQAFLNYYDLLSLFILAWLILCQGEK